MNVIEHVEIEVLRVSWKVGRLGLGLKRVFLNVSRPVCAFVIDVVQSEVTSVDNKNGAWKKSGGFLDVLDCGSESRCFGHHRSGVRSSDRIMEVTFVTWRFRWVSSPTCLPSWSLLFHAVFYCTRGRV